MKFLVDAQLPPALCGWLHQRGHDAEHVTALGLGAASDAAVVARAIQDEAILVTKDEGFVVLRLPDRFVLRWLRCGNSTNRALSHWLAQRWIAIESALRAGERFVEAR